MVYSVILSTFPSKKEAKKVSEMLLEKKLAACVNIIDKIESAYWWKGKIEKGKEVLVIIKTRESLVEKVIDEVKKNHSYTVPEIIEIPIKKGNRSYLNWIDEVTR